MHKLSLKELLDNLKSSPRVRGIFLTGTTATTLNSASDIDIVVLLDKNTEELKSIYTTIDNRFSDVFFFDLDFLAELNNATEVSANNFDGMFLNWLINGKVEYDPDNLLLPLKIKATETPALQKVHESEKRDFWIKINYNFIANLRYFNATDELYHKALEIRLLYSVVELITAYFSLREIAWRGEKVALKFFEENDTNYLATFEAYSKSNSLFEKMDNYQKLFFLTFFGEFQKWDNSFIIPLTKHNHYNKEMSDFWNKLTQG